MLAAPRQESCILKITVAIIGPRGPVWKRETGLPDRHMHAVCLPGPTCWVSEAGRRESAPGFCQLRL